MFIARLRSASNSHINRHTKRQKKTYSEYVSFVYIVYLNETVYKKFHWSNQNYDVCRVFNKFGKLINVTYFTMYLWQELSIKRLPDMTFDIVTVDDIWQLKYFNFFWKWPLCQFFSWLFLLGVYCLCKLQTI